MCIVDLTNAVMTLQTAVLQMAISKTTVAQLNLYYVYTGAHDSYSGEHSNYYNNGGQSRGIAIVVLYCICIIVVKCIYTQEGIIGVETGVGGEEKMGAGEKLVIKN